MLDSLSWVRCWYATQGQIDLSTQNRDLSLVHAPFASRALLACRRYSREPAAEARKAIKASASSVPRGYRSLGFFSRQRMTIADNDAGTRLFASSSATGFSCTCLYPTENESAPSNGGYPASD